jgi:hypothetical protein
VERLIQYLDELEDLIYATPLIAEQLRRAAQRILFLVTSVILQTAVIALALKHPPLALGVATLLVVGLLLRAVIVPIPRKFATT